MEDHQNSIDVTKKSFESSFAENNYYNKQTNDNDQLRSILGILNLKDGNRILDLGTGSGYLAFPIAEAYPNCKVIGLDIVSNTLKENNKKAILQNLLNLNFIDYEGFYLPFPDHSFDVIVTRYALHHFPKIELTFREMARVLKQGGQLFISDPTPNENDSNRFVDAYMQVKKDGHIKFYTFEEFTSLAEKSGFSFKASYNSKIRFPRKEAPKYNTLLESIDQKVLSGYEVLILGDEIYITEDVLNLNFIRL